MRKLIYHQPPPLIYSVISGVIEYQKYLTEDIIGSYN